MRDEAVAGRSGTFNDAQNSYLQEMERALDDEDTISKESFECIHMRQKAEAVKKVYYITHFVFNLEY